VFYHYRWIVYLLALHFKRFLPDKRLVVLFTVLSCNIKGDDIMIYLLILLIIVSSAFFMSLSKLSV